MGKQSKGENKGKGSEEGKKNDQSSKAIPHLPTEVVAIIAECLIGQDAFGTTANLNLVSRTVHHETLPVLYESVFFKQNHQKDESSTETLPVGFKYTKFAFYGNRDDQPFAEQMPNLVFTVNVDLTNSRVEGDACRIRLFKSVSAATVFTVLKTPLRHPTWDHRLCAASMLEATDPYFDPRNPLHMELVMQLPLSRQCMLENAKPVARPVDAIRMVHLMKPGVYLHSNSPSHLHDITTNLTLYSTEIIHVKSEGHDNKAIALTAIELLKLGGLQSSSSNIGDVEVEDYEADAETQHCGTICIRRRAYVHWQLKLELDKAAFESFVDRLEAKIALMPEIMQFRLDITITDVLGVHELRLLLDRLHQIYVLNLNSAQHVLPSDDNPLEIVQIKSSIHRSPGASRTLEEVSGSLLVLQEGPDDTKITIILDFDKEHVHSQESN